MIRNIAFYLFVDLEGLPERRAFFRDLCEKLGLKGTIILSSEGINGFLAGEEARVQSFEAKIRELPEFAALEFKVSLSETVPFNRLFIKLKKEIIPFGHPEVRPAQMTGTRLEAPELKRWLDEGRDVLLLDTRNDYEIEKGTFKGARDLRIRNFREFPEKLDAVRAELGEKPVVMFCTGGIRCEKATAFAQQRGFKEVYQLEGGILKYFELCGSEHYVGDCFVFDERRAVDSLLKESHPAK